MKTPKTATKLIAIVIALGLAAITTAWDTHQVDAAKFDAKTTGMFGVARGAIRVSATAADTNSRQFGVLSLGPSQTIRIHIANTVTQNPPNPGDDNSVRRVMLAFDTYRPSNTAEDPCVTRYTYDTRKESRVSLAAGETVSFDYTNTTDRPVQISAGMLGGPDTRTLIVMLEVIDNGTGRSSFAMGPIPDNQ